MEQIAQISKKNIQLCLEGRISNKKNDSFIFNTYFFF